MCLSVVEILLFNCSNAFVADCLLAVTNSSIKPVFMLNTAAVFNLSQFHFLSLQLCQAKYEYLLIISICFTHLLMMATIKKKCFYRFGKNITKKS